MYFMMKSEINNFNTINTQTKVRRMAYIKMIIAMFNKSDYYPSSLFNKKVELEAQKYNDDLLKYSNSRGIIKITQRGNSSKPYIETTLALKLLFTQNNMYKLSKYGKLFNVLDNELNIITDNYFQLLDYQKSFILFFILEKDGLYLQLLIDLIFHKKQTTIKELKEVFQKYLIEQLQSNIDNPNIPNKLKNEIILKMRRVQNWENPQRYLEHIIEPRVNWLLDLDILDRDDFIKNRLLLSKQGLVIVNKLNSSFDICTDFFNLINQMYLTNTIGIDENNFELIDNYIDKSFFLFKTIAPNRVTASQAILYTCYMMLFKERIIVNFCTIKNYLSSKDNTKFIFDWYKTEQDGSIRRKNDLRDFRIKRESI